MISVNSFSICLHTCVFILLINSDLSHARQEQKELPMSLWMKYNTAEVIEYWGYKSETHKVLTEDGYVLTNFRIPNPGGYPILFVHGLTVSSDCWFLRNPKVDLAFLLYNRGYDIWFWNARGNMYSLEHSNPNMTWKEYYKYTIHELGHYDTAASIDYILNVTGQRHVATIGHSLGTSNVPLLLSSRPEYQKKVSINILMAQSVFLKDVFLKDVLEFMYTIYERYMIFDNTARFYLRDTDEEKLKSFFCDYKSPLFPICLSFLEQFSGPKSTQGERLPVTKMMTKIPTGSSLYVIRHMMQLVRTGKFKQYNWGPEENLRRYGSRTTQLYPLNKIKTPTAIYYACCNDFLSSKKGAFILKSKLQNVIRFHEVAYKRYNHGDYLWGKDNFDLLYRDIIELVDKYSGWTGQKELIYEGYTASKSNIILRAPNTTNSYLLSEEYQENSWS